MKAARNYNPQSKSWRVRYIDERTGLLRVRYYNIEDNAEDFARFVRYSPDFTLVDLCYFRWTSSEWIIRGLFSIVRDGYEQK